MNVQAPKVLAVQQAERDALKEEHAAKLAQRVATLEPLRQALKQAREQAVLAREALGK